MDGSPPSLRSLFLSAKAKEADLQYGGSSSDLYAETLQNAISTLEECRELMRRLAIFSPNETSEDLATSSIQ